MRDRTTFLWLSAAILLLVFPGRYWIRSAPNPSFGRPVTPLDGSDSNAARQWLFLRHAQSVVPPGSTYTVIAAAPDVEMNLYMMSLGLLPHGQGLPSSYYGIRTPEAAAIARYVLAYDNAPISGELRLRAAFPEGRVYERPTHR